VDTVSPLDDQLLIAGAARENLSSVSF
jgi:hypothetical protein